MMILPKFDFSGRWTMNAAAAIVAATGFVDAKPEVEIFSNSFLRRPPAERSPPPAVTLDESSLRVNLEPYGGGGGGGGGVGGLISVTSRSTLPMLFDCGAFPDEEARFLGIDCVDHPTPAKFVVEVGTEGCLTIWVNDIELNPGLNHSSLAFESSKLKSGT